MPLWRLPKSGKDGAEGPIGKQGPPGKDGIDGRDGIDGQQGPPGKDGAKGPKGDRGPRGYQGPRGDRGPSGRSLFGGGGSTFSAQDVFNSLEAGSNITLSFNANTQKTIIASTGSGGTTDHNLLNNLGWSVAGHTIDTDFLPDTTQVYNLGTDTFAWRSLMVRGISTDGVFLKSDAVASTGTSPHLHVIGLPDLGDELVGSLNVEWTGIQEKLSLNMTGGQFLVNHSIEFTANTDDQYISAKPHFTPYSDDLYDLGINSATPFVRRWRNAYISGNLSDGTNSLTVAQAKTAYTHSQATGNPHGATTSDISEGTNLYFTDERVDDRVVALLVAGTGISLSYNDPANTLTITSTITQYTDEMAQDAVGGALTDSTTIDFTYSDVANTITAIVINDSIDNTKLANMAQATIKGRAAAAGTGDPTDLTAAQVATIVNASLDHGTLTGLSDDDHTIYLLASGGRALTGNWGAGTTQVTFGSATASTVGRINSYASDTIPGLWVHLGGTANELVWQAGASNTAGSRYGFRKRIDNSSTGDMFDDRNNDGTNWVQMVRYFRGTGRIFIGSGSAASAITSELLQVAGLIKASAGLDVNGSGGNDATGNALRVWANAGDSGVALLKTIPAAFSNTGAVAINTNSVLGALTIAGKSSGDPGFWLETPGIADARTLYFGPSNQYGHGNKNEEVTYGDRYSFHRNGSTTDVVDGVVRRDNGNWGIGSGWTTLVRPAYQLDVVDDIRAQRSILIGGDVGSGLASHITLTDVIAAVSGATPAVLGNTGGGPVGANQSGWYKFYDGTTIKYIPVWT